MNKNQIYGNVKVALEKLYSAGYLEEFALANRSLAELWRLLSEYDAAVASAEVLEYLKTKQATVHFYKTGDFSVVVTFDNKRVQSNSLLGIFQILEKMENEHADTTRDADSRNVAPQDSDGTSDAGRY